jgi:hypothetical protein
MKFKSILKPFFLFISTLLLSFASVAQIQRNILINALHDKPVSDYLTNIDAWRKENKEKLKKKIAALPDSVKNEFIHDADADLNYEWPTLTASLYLDYKFTGNRSDFQDVQNERRKVLNQLVIGELISGNKKYLPQIVNGLLTTLEESTWVLPAHIVLQKAGSGLPDPNEEIIDLGDAITAPMIAVTQYMLYDELEKYAPIINKRIDAELHKRIVAPYLQRNDLWWMGFKGQAVNNWNAWCNTNVLHTVLLNEKNEDTIALVVDKVMRSADNFINQYPADGGCDEGPSYWSEAGGKLIRLLHLLNSVSGGKLSWTGNKLLHDMGTYIYKMQITGNYFVNFADALPKTIPNPESVFRFGEMFNDDALKQFGAYLFNLDKKEIGNNKNVAEFLQTLDVYKELTTTRPKAPMPAYSCLPDLEVVTARTKSGSDNGLFLAVQGGNNGESHNHNDVGNFIIYAWGKPIIVDAGVGTYTAQTFSSRRYELWNMQSQWHNSPTVNGVMQKAGKEFKATDFTCENKNGIEIKMDIAKAYPSEAAVKSWQRDFLFNQNKNIISLKENYELNKWLTDTKINFLTSCTVKEEKRGILIFSNADGKQVLVMKYNPANLSVIVEEKVIDDKRIAASWNGKLYHVVFTLKKHSLKGENKFEFSMPDSKR